MDVLVEGVVPPVTAAAVEPVEIELARAARARARARFSRASSLRPSRSNKRPMFARSPARGTAWGMSGRERRILFSGTSARAHVGDIDSVCNYCSRELEIAHDGNA